MCRCDSVTASIIHFPYFPFISLLIPLLISLDALEALIILTATKPVPVRRTNKRDRTVRRRRRPSTFPPGFFLPAAESRISNHLRSGRERYNRRGRRRRWQEGCLYVDRTPLGSNRSVRDTEETGFRRQILAASSGSPVYRPRRLTAEYPARKRQETLGALSSQPVHLESCAAIPPLPATRNLERAPQQTRFRKPRSAVFHGDNSGASWERDIPPGEADSICGSVILRNSVTRFFFVRSKGEIRRNRECLSGHDRCYYIMLICNFENYKITWNYMENVKIMKITLHINFIFVTH